MDRLPQTHTITLSKRTIISAITAVWAVLLIASITQDVLIGISGDLARKVWRLDVDVEMSFYTWFSSILLAFSSLVLALIAMEKKALNDRFRLHWIALALIFLLLSADEAVSLHEVLSKVLTKGLGTHGYLYFAWVIPAFIMCVFGLAMYGTFIFAFPPKLRTLLILSSVIFLSGAIGMEMLAGKLVSDSQNSIYTLQYRAITTVEEALEGLGVILFLYTILSYWQWSSGKFKEFVKAH